MSIYRIKPLEWQGRSATCVLGSYNVARRWTDEEADDATEGNGSWYWSYCFDEHYDEGSTDCESEAEGKAAAEAHYLERLLPALELVHLAPARVPSHCSNDYNPSI